jgi:hypothetical protein
MCSQSITRRCRAAPSACASRRRHDAHIADLIAALEELWAACPVGKGQYVRLAAA